jgi:hypothetical protein
MSSFSLFFENFLACVDPLTMFKILGAAEKLQSSHGLIQVYFYPFMSSKAQSISWVVPIIYEIAKFWSCPRVFFHATQNHSIVFWIFFLSLLHALLSLDFHLCFLFS